MPRDRIVTESDGPFVDINGAPAAPWDTSSVLMHFAATWQCAAEEVAGIVGDNFIRLVGGDVSI